MSRYELRPLRSDDFAALVAADEHVCGAAGASTLGRYDVRVVCESFRDACSVCFAELDGFSGPEDRDLVSDVGRDSIARVGARWHHLGLAPAGALVAAEVGA